MTTKKEIRERLYTPLDYEESMNYVNCYFERQKTAYNKQVVVICSVNKDGSVFYVEKQMKIINTNPSQTNDQGGTTIPTKQITIDTNSPRLPRKKGKLVYCNMNSIINGSNIRPVGLMIDNILPLNLTTEDMIYNRTNLHASVKIRAIIYCMHKRRLGTWMQNKFREVWILECVITLCYDFIFHAHMENSLYYKLSRNFMPSA